MPRGKAAAAAGGHAAKKPRAPKGHKLAEKFPNGEVLRDLCKKDWRLGDVIGKGGFGMIYSATDEMSGKVGADAKFVVKIEPIGNGPLFCEQHFYQRVAKPDCIEAFVKKNKLKYLGVPRYLASGQHVHNGVTYRFLVMDRFGTDLQIIFEGAGKQFSQQTVFALALRLIDSLEYLHEMNYVHADMKASNCLLGYKSNKVNPDTVFLVDYGLATKYTTSDNEHRTYKEDPRKAHDGTIEFTSRDAHKGVDASRRSDLEILGYCLLQWLCGRLPWEDKLTDPNYVAQSKSKYMGDISSLMKKCFPQGSVPVEISTFLTSVVKLGYDEKPNYAKMRDIFQKGLNRLGVKDSWKLALPLGGAKPKSPKKGVKRPHSAADTEPVVKQKARVASPKARVASPKAKVATPKSKVATPKATSKTGTPKANALASPPKTAAQRAVLKVIAKAKNTKSPVQKGSPKKQVQKGSPKGQKKPATPKTGGKATPRGKKTAPANPPTVKAASPATAKLLGKRAIGVASPVAGSSAENGDHPVKKRKVVRRKNVQQMEMAVQTSPGLKQNR